MSAEPVSYIPFKYCLYTKPNTHVVYENLSYLPWQTTPNGRNVLTNYTENLPTDAKIIHNNDDFYVVRTKDSSLPHILSQYHKISTSTVCVSVLKDEHLFNPDHSFKTDLLQNVDSLCSYQKISLIIRSQQQDTYEFIVVGDPDSVKIAENKLRLMIDQMNPLVYIDYIDLETISLLPLIGGVEFNNFKQIAKQTNCHLYLPNLLPNTYNQVSIPDTKIYITGLQSQVVLTKTLIAKIKQNIISPFIKNVPMVLEKKTMLLLLEQHDPLISIMYKNECFIQFPTLQSDESVLIFQANNLEAIERSIEQFLFLLRNIYSTMCESLDNLVDMELDRIFFDICSYSNCLIQVNGNKLSITGSKNETKRAVTLLSNYQSTLIGLQRIKAIKYSIELNNEEREFIGGKKNGKLLKIMNNSQSIVKIIPFSNFSFILELNSQNLHQSLMGLNMVEDELPTSVTFNIPESFHRQIIGVGGSTVQTIMRRYNVFIKFSNTFLFNGEDDVSKLEFNPVQTFVRKNNVIIKCPSKNGNNIPYAKSELEKLVQNCSNISYFNTFIKLSRSHWRLLSNNSIGINNSIKKLNQNSSNSTFVADLEKKTNTLIKFPINEPMSLELLEIKGVEKNSEKCAKLFEKKLPVDYEFKLAYNPKFAEIASVDRNSKKMVFENRNLASSIGFKFLNEISVPLKLLYNVEVQVFYNPKLENDEEDLFNNNTITNDIGHYNSASLSSMNCKNFINDIKNLSPSSPNFEFFQLQNTDTKETPQFHSIILSYFKEEVEDSVFEKCLEILTSFLREHKIIIIDKNFNDDKGFIIDGSSISSTHIHSNHLELNKENINYQDQFHPDLQRFQQNWYMQQQPFINQQKPNYRTLNPRNRWGSNNI